MGRDHVGTPADPEPMPPALPDSLSASGAVWGTGVATPHGRLLWVDDAFCAALGRSRDELVSAGLADILSLEAEELAWWEPNGRMVRLPPDGGGPALRVTGLVERDGPGPWALVIEVEGGARLTAGKGGAAPAVFALHRGGKLVAVWGPIREVLGVTRAAVGRRLPSLLKEDPLIGTLVRRTLRGEPTTGLFVSEATVREVHFFPAEDPAGGKPGAVGVAYDASGLQRHLGEIVPGGMEREAALAELARLALRNPEASPLLEAAARLVHSALDAEACAVSEYLPGGQGFHVRAAVGLPSSAPRLVASPGVPPSVTVAATAGLTETPGGSLVVPIKGPAAFGCLAVRLGPRRSFSAEDKGFLLAAAEIVTAALERIAHDEHRRRASLHDPLTGLPTGTLIEDHLSQALARSKRHGSQVALLSVGLDGFKVVNDTLGSGAGDELLGAVAQRLLATLRPADTLGRLGGDGFMVVCEDLAGEADARAVSRRLVASFQKPFRLSRCDVSVSASVGVAVAGATTNTAALHAEADAALHRAKQFEGPSVAFCDEVMRSGGADASDREIRKR